MQKGSELSFYGGYEKLMICPQPPPTDSKQDILCFETRLPPQLLVEVAAAFICEGGHDAAYRVFAALKIQPHRPSHRLEQDVLFDHQPHAGGSGAAVVVATMLPMAAPRA